MMMMMFVTFDLVPDVISTVNLVGDVRGGQPGVHVSWEEPQSVLPILKYVVNSAKSSTSVGKLFSLSPSLNFFYFSELDPGTSYNFIVLASSAAGSAHFSSTRSLTTHNGENIYGVCLYVHGFKVLWYVILLIIYICFCMFVI